MAITFTKEPEGIYPAYNDSYIEFSSSLANNNKAEITVYPVLTFPNVFVLYPDSDGNYIFNLKEAVKVIFNENGFKDSNFFTDDYWKSISGLYLSQDILVKVLSDVSSEQQAKTYEFFKAVKQVGENITTNPFRLLSYSNDGINHELTYFEGFPFSFDLQRVEYVLGKVLKVKSLNTGNETQDIPVTATGAFRMNIDRSEGNNWTVGNILPLITGLNRLEVYEDEVFKSNVLLTKREICTGVYLKWFNREGGFSHFLFNSEFIESVKANDAGIVLSNEFNNISDLTGLENSTGKDALRSFILKARYNESEYETLKDIFISPFVQIYTSFEANVIGTFIDVLIKGSLTNSKKRAMNEIILNVFLPGMITAKL